MSARRQFFTPGWIVYHLATWGAVAAMVLLGRWQLDVSNRKHFDLQNFGYTLQWWAFSAFAILFWARTIRDKLHPPRTELVPVEPSTRGAAYLTTPSSPTVYRGYVMPRMSDSQTRPVDSVHAEYNDYLWQLSLGDSAGGPAPSRPGDPPSRPADPPSLPSRPS